MIQSKRAGAVCIYSESPKLKCDYIVRLEDIKVLSILTGWTEEHRVRINAWWQFYSKGKFRVMTMLNKGNLKIQLNLTIPPASNGDSF